MTASLLERFGANCEQAVRRYMPDPFVLVLLLTITSFALCLWLTPSVPSDLLKFWNLGFWELLSFAMQMVLIVVTGEALAEAPIVQTLLRKACAIPRTAKGAVFGLTFFALAIGWVHWGFGLVISSIAARQIGQTLQHRKISVHYPVLGVAAYMSMLLWHAGATASAPLLINTPGHFLEHQIGIVPLSQTVWLTRNLIVCSVLAVLIPFIVTWMLPRRGIRQIDEFDAELSPISTKKPSLEKAKTFAEKLERSYTVNATVGLLGILFLTQYFKQEGLNLNHNVVNFLFLTLGILLHRNPTEYAKAISTSLKGTGGIVLQFPFYGGIMGLMRESGLGTSLARVFVESATAQTLPFFAYIASVVTKLFIPSGGGEWAVEGPVMLQAAKQLGAHTGLTTMGIAYGNMVGNMFQPFWAIPLLSIMGLRARDIMGFCLVIFIVAFPILGIALLIP